MKINQARVELSKIIGGDSAVEPAKMDFSELVLKRTASQAPLLTVPTRDSYLAALRAWISPTFGGRPIAEITRDEIQ